MAEVELPSKTATTDAELKNGATVETKTDELEDTKISQESDADPTEQNMIQKTGKDYSKLYGHPDRWSWLDSSEFEENEVYLVMKTHPCISKCIGITVGLMGLALIVTSVWAGYIYTFAETDPSSPRFFQSKLCSAVTMVNQELLNETLMLECDIDVPAIDTIGNFFWIIWAFFLVSVSFFGCCAPPDRELVIEKDSDTGYIRERNWNYCSYCCTRAHCGKPRIVCEFTPSVVYITMEVEKRIDGVGGWGFTRWGLTNPTKVLIMRDLHDGAMLHTIDAHDILCCYQPTCCVKEAEYYLITLKQRLESHLRGI